MHGNIAFKFEIISQAVRGRKLITCQGGGGFEGGYNFKTSPLLGGKFFTGKKREGGQILWPSISSLGNLTSVIYPRSRGWWGKGKNLTWYQVPREGLLYLKNKKDRKCHYKAYDVKRETRKAVAAGSFEELAKAGELFCCLISEIQSDMYSECLQRGYDTVNTRV